MSGPTYFLLSEAVLIDLYGLDHGQQNAQTDVVRIGREVRPAERPIFLAAPKSAHCLAAGWSTIWP
jgi:hypothetical protein